MFQCRCAACDLLFYCTLSKLAKSAKLPKASKPEPVAEPAVGPPVVLSNGLFPSADQGSPPPDELLGIVGRVGGLDCLGGAGRGGGALLFLGGSSGVEPSDLMASEGEAIVLGAKGSSAACRKKNCKKINNTKKCTAMFVRIPMGKDFRLLFQKRRQTRHWQRNLRRTIGKMDLF